MVKANDERRDTERPDTAALGVFLCAPRATTRTIVRVNNQGSANSVQLAEASTCWTPAM